MNPARALAAGLAVLAVTAAHGQPTRPPRLLVLLVVDQMRADYIDKYGHQWSAGLRRLVTEGAWFRQAAYPYLNTVTCPGHATIATGRFPYAHGLVLNAWFDREAGRLVGCVDDPAFPIVSYGQPVGGGVSPRFLQVPTLADELRVQSAVRPRIVSLSLKDRGAVPLAGRQADAVVWLNAAARALVTSSFYTKTPVAFVQRFTTSRPIQADFGKVWTRQLPASAYLFDDEVAAETAPAPWTPAFPHLIDQGPSAPSGRVVELWRESPFADEYLVGLAEAAIEALALGRGPGTDLLAISFSTLDYVGHDFGPWSHEVQDVLVRLDASLGTLLAALDRRVGRGGYVAVLTSDHGVTPIPETITRKGVDAGRVAATEVISRIQRTLEAALGPGRHVARLTSGHIYLAPGVADRLRSRPDAWRAVQESLNDLPGVDGMIDAAAAQTSTSDGHPNHGVRRAAALGHDPTRGGDLLIMLRPYWFFRAEDATSHGSLSEHDARVPLLLMGPGIRAGHYFQPVTPADIAPTLAFLAGITMTARDGRVLHEALVPPGRTAK